MLRRRFLVGSLVAALGLLIALPGQAGTITKRTFPSETLGRDYAYTIYLPDGYETSGLSYPVLYLLHGAGGDENEWPVKGQVQPTADALIAEGRMPPALIVMPGHTQAWWVDGNAENAETAFIEEVIPHIEANFRAIPDRSGRVVAGLSAGGYGTVNFVLKHPGLFAAGAALSPAVYVPVPPEHSSGRRHPPFQKDGAFDPASWERLNYPQHIDAYKAQDLKVPLYINSGDHDTFDIAYHAAVLYQAFREHQPELVEYRVIDGDHEWPVWVATLGDAMAYVFQYTSRPVGMVKP